jgi:glycerol uptake facilitator protein
MTDEGVQASLVRRLLAEFVGTLLLVAVGAGAATVLLVGRAERFLTLPPVPEGGDPTQNEFFGALMENSFGDALPVAIAFAVVLAVVIYAFGGISGGHFNPAVTFGLAVVNRFSWKDVIPYWVVQCAGGLAGAFVVVAIFFRGGDVIGGEDVLFGATVIAEQVPSWKAVAAEAFLTFLLVTAIMAVAVDPRAPKGWSGLIIGLALGGGILVTLSVTGGSANFARSLGPFVASVFYDTPKIPWEDLLVYAGGPLVGAAAAALIYESVTGLEQIAPPPPRPGAATGPTEPPVGATVGAPLPPPPPPPD